MNVRTLPVVGGAIALTLSAVLGAALTSPAIADAQPEGSGGVPGDPQHVPVGTRSRAPVAARSFVAPSAASTAQIKVSYHDFPADARASFQRAVDRWKTLVSSTVPIRVDVTWAPLSEGSLGGARPDHYYYNFMNAPFGDTYYASALADKIAGADVDPGQPDIVATFNSSFPSWNLSKKPAGAGQEDFQTVVMHELGHGLGFGGNGAVTGNKGTIINGLHSVYDLYTTLGSGTELTSLADPSTRLKSALTSDDLFFDSPQVRAANGGQPAKLHAPSTYEGGSSYSHLDEDTYPPGSINSLMTPGFDYGETTRVEGPIMAAMFTTMGW